MRRSTGVLVLLSVFFLGFKVLRFQTLAYTFHDLYVFEQLASGWIDGRPFLYDNFWGDHQRIHNYYTVWIWGPICYRMGVYGLFLIQTLLLLVSYGLTNQRLAKAGVPIWARYGLLVVVLLGPVSAWLNDHPGTGWHTELTYLPVGILFALALTGQNRVWSVLTGLVLILIKEDGAVLAAMIHLAYFSITYLRQHPTQSGWLLWRERRFWVISLGWGAVFIAGMTWLAYLNHFAEPRLRGALLLIAKNIDTITFWRQTGKEIGTTLLLLLPAGGFIYLLSTQLTHIIRGKLFIIYGLGILVLSALNFVQSSLYYGDPSVYHSVGWTWPPRFVLPWTFTATFLIIMLVLFPPVQPAPVRSVWLVIGGLVFMQLPILAVARPDLPHLAEWKALVRGRVSPYKERRYLDPTDLVVVRCLADQLPARSTVLAFEYLLPYFHKHDIVWPTGKQYQLADLALLSIDDKQNVRADLLMRRPYQIRRLKGYFLYVAADYQPVIQSCIR